MNGLYLQLHAYMLRVNIPYGCLSSRQLRQLAFIARRYDRNFGHFTTRQNIQYNWIKLDETPDVLAALAAVEMNAMQSSGNCVRNITADQFAGRARDEIEDPRPWCELIRQWSILHPEFSYLPRKFKIAVSGAPQRPGRGEAARRGPVPAPECGRRDRLRSDRGRRAGTTALSSATPSGSGWRRKTCCPTWKRSCASTTWAAAGTTRRRPASRSR